MKDEPHVQSTQFNSLCVVTKGVGEDLKFWIPWVDIEHLKKLSNHSEISAAFKDYTGFPCSCPLITNHIHCQLFSKTEQMFLDWFLNLPGSNFTTICKPLQWTICCLFLFKVILLQLQEAFSKLYSFRFHGHSILDLREVSVSTAQKLLMAKLCCQKVKARRQT